MAKKTITDNTSKALKKSPIIECLIEIFLPKSFDWNLDDQITVFYEKELKSQYPKERSLEENQFEFRIEDGNVTNNHSASKRYRFLSKDEKALIQVSNNYCVFNQLKPYPKSFDFVLKKALPFFDNYISFTSPNVKDRKIKAVGVRYINEIKLEEKECISNVFKIYPSLNILNWSDKSQTIPFAMQIKAPHKQYDLIVNLNYIGNFEGQDTYLFDLYGRLNKEIKVSDLQTEIKGVQKELESIFFESLTLNGYKMFK